jgi:hypothetical protein
MINGNMITETKESFLKFFTSIKELDRIAVVVATKDKQVVKVIHYPPSPSHHHPPFPPPCHKSTCLRIVIWVVNVKSAVIYSVFASKFIYYLIIMDAVI